MSFISWIMAANVPRPGVFLALCLLRLRSSHGKVIEAHIHLRALRPASSDRRSSHAFFCLASLEHSSAHLRQASAQRENASILGCLAAALANSSQPLAHPPQIGEADF